jgi:Ca2+-binding RTX toxin-like protein
VAQLKNLVIQGTNAAETITGYDDTNDVSHAGAGNDIVYGRAGNDTLHGDAGDDQLHGEDGNDQLFGGDGADYLNGGNGDDVLTGGIGNDAFDGRSGADTYAFGRGVGQDIIYDWDGQTNLDRILVAADTRSDEVSVSRSVDELVLQITPTGDQQTVHWWFRGGTQDLYSLRQVDFADGTVWDVARLQELSGAVQGGEAADTLNGTAGANVLRGFGGNDSLSGAAGNDELEGGAGADTLSGDAGNDTLRGGLGADTYVFGTGGGGDTVVENDATPSTNDTLRFGSSIDPLDVILTRNVNDLVLAVHGSTDQVTVKDWYVGGAREIETIEAADGSELLSSQVQQLIQDMATYSATSGLTWAQAIDQRPEEVETVLGAHWQPGS